MLSNVVPQDGLHMRVKFMFYAGFVGRIIRVDDSVYSCDIIVCDFYYFLLMHVLNYQSDAIIDFILFRI